MNNVDQDSQGHIYVLSPRGYSAYEIAVQQGFVGTEDEWLASLVGPEGPDGKSAYEVAVENGYIGTEQEWVNDFLTPDGYYNKQTIDSKENKLQSQITYLGSGSPLVANSLIDMIDTTRVYVNTSDGNWYYYDGDSWEIGGVYESTQYEDVITTSTINMNITGYLRASNGTLSATNGFKASDYIEVNDTQYVNAYLYQQTNVVGLICFYDENKNFIKSYYGEDDVSTGFINITQPIPFNCKYIRVSSKTQPGYYSQLRVNVVNRINNVANEVTQKIKLEMDIVGYLRPNGTVSTTNGFRCTDYIDVKFGENIIGRLKQVSSNIGLVCFYDINKNLISTYTGDGTEDTKFITIDVNVPLKAKYVRLSTKSDDVLYYSYWISSVTNWIDSINELVDSENINYYVDVNNNSPSGQNYNSLMDCLKYIELQNYSKPVNVYIKGGTYDIFEELGGVEFLSSITDEDTAYTINQPWLYNVNLIGLGNVVLEYKPTIEVVNEYPLGEGLIAPLNVRGNVNIENITIECQYCRYAIHDETSGETKYNNTYHNYKNVICKMITKSTGSTGGHTFGLGFDNGQSYLFENCRLINNNNITTTNSSLYIHNRTSYGGNFTIKDCILETVGSYGVILSNVGSQERTIVNVSNCNFNKKIYIRSENHTSVVNCFQIYMNNCNNINIDYTNDITSNPYTPIIKNIIQS